MTSRSVAAALFVSSLTVFAADKKYGTGPLEVAKKVQVLPDAEVNRRLLGLAKMFKLTEITRGAEVIWSASDPATDPMPALSHPERLGLVAALQRKPMNAEVDVLVKEGDAFVPVTVTWDDAEKVSLGSGPPVKSLYAPPTTAEALSKQYGVGEFLEGDQTWDATALSVVGQALALLSKEDLALIKGVPFFRSKTHPRQRAVYTRGNEAPRVELFDSAFQLDDESFMGPVTAPLPDSVGVLLHELGHAIVDVRLRELSMKGRAEVAKAKQLKEAKDPKMNAQIDVANALTNGLNGLDDANKKAGGRLAEREFAATLAPAKSPTTYGAKNAGENFAECYRLYRADPEALARVSPDALRWFEAGTYRTLALEPVQ